MTLSDFLDAEIAAGFFPGGAALVGTSEEVLQAAFSGSAAVEPNREALREDTLFDLASLTKPLAGGALFALSGLPLDATPGRFLPPWKATRYEGITLERLLTHTSGLPAWYPLYARGEGPDAYGRALAALEPVTVPGSAVIYSDLNFLLLAEILEREFGRLDRAFAELVAAPARSEARFLPDDAAPTAATEKGDATERRMTAELGLSYAGFRTGVVRGEVHDGNALRRGGLSAHAGLFGTARDVWALARGWLAPERAALAADRTSGLPEARGLAWQGLRGAGSAVPEMSHGAFGHTGFTGTSVWLEPERDRVVVLLTNRIHPAVKPQDFNEVRRRFHRLAMEV